MKSSERVPVVRWGCFGDVEEGCEECVSIPREDQESPDELDVSSFADPEEDAGGDEIAEELEDVAGWAFILWCRLRELQVALAEGVRNE